MAQPDVIEFSPSERRRVLAAMEEIAGEGRGWINLQPAVDPDDLDDGQGGIFRIFSAQGPPVPLCTWTPAERGRRAPPAMSLGVQHGTGGRLVKLLADMGIEVPPEWRVLQDQPRRGLVVSVPADEAHERILAWLIEVGEAVCRARHDGWVAVVHRPRR